MGIIKFCDMCGITFRKTEYQNGFFVCNKCSKDNKKIKVECQHKWNNPKWLITFRKKCIKCGERCYI